MEVKPPKGAEASSNDESGNEDGKHGTVAEQQTPEQLAATNERLLTESRKNREAYLRTKKDLEDRVKADMQKQGEYKALAEKLAAENTTLKKSFRDEKVTGEVTKALEKAGVVKADGAWKLGRMDLLQYDEDSREVHGVQSFVDELKKEYPMLFAAPKTPVINPTVPSGRAPVVPGKQLKDLTKDEIMDQLRALPKQ